MTKQNKTKKRRWLKKKNRASVLASILLILLMSLRVVAQFVRPYRANILAQAQVADASDDLPAEDLAANVLTDFFYLLANENFTEAATLYNGDFGTLPDTFPADADDPAALLQDACRLHTCLPVHSVHAMTTPSPDMYEFTVTFASQDGRLLTHTAPGDRQTAEFVVDVVRDGDQYRIYAMPTGSIFDS